MHYRSGLAWDFWDFSDLVGRMTKNKPLLKSDINLLYMNTVYNNTGIMSELIHLTDDTGENLDKRREETKNEKEEILKSDLQLGVDTFSITRPCYAFVRQCIVFQQLRRVFASNTNVSEIFSRFRFFCHPRKECIRPIRQHVVKTSRFIIHHLIHRWFFCSFAAFIRVPLCGKDLNILLFW